MYKRQGLKEAVGYGHLGYPVLMAADIIIYQGVKAVSYTHLDVYKRQVVAYPPFGTSVVFMKDKKRIDFASARKEFYRFPGAAPDVEYSDLKKDLFRRDFTLNAMAISIYPDNWGELYDFFGGYRDLRSKILRILHPLSFVDDPARSIRAVRFEKKYGFHIEPFTMSLLKQTIRKNLLDSIKPCLLYTSRCV